MFYGIRSEDEESVLNFLDMYPDTRVFLERTLAPVVIDLLGEGVCADLKFVPAYDSFDEDGIYVQISFRGEDYDAYDQLRYDILDHITDEIPDNLTIGFF